MSIYSNLASGAAQDARAYIRAVLDLLGTRDPLKVLGTTVEFCRDRTRGVDPHRLSTPERAGKWSAAGVLHHLADSELVWGYRLRRVIAEDRPLLTGFDQDLWAERLGYARADAGEALASFAAFRAANLALLTRATDDDLDRVGVHEERGEETVRHMMRLYAGHDLVHRRQLDRILEQVTGSG